LAEQISHGPSAKEADQHYLRALALAEKLPDRGRERFLATWGIWFAAVISGRGAEGLRLAEDLLAIARQLGNPDLLLEAYHSQVPMLLKRPDFAGMAHAAQEVVRLYDRERHRDHAFYFGGHDSRMCGRSFHALALWGQGLFVQAQAMSWRAVEDARDLGHLFSLTHAYQRAGMTMMLLRDLAACRTVADDLYPIAERNKFAWPLADAIYLRGWLATQDGDSSGIAAMLESVYQPFFAAFRPVYLILIAAEHLRAGDFAAATALLDRTVTESEQQTNHFCEPEIPRLRGEILLARSRDNAAAAERAFRDALALAARQACRPLELRAATSLARLLADGSRREEARDVLAPIYATFTEGFEKPDLAEAAALLAALG
jgi:predicted ATPase